MRRFTTFVIFLLCGLALFPLYTRFKAYAAPIPPGVTLAGVDVDGIKDVAEIRSHLQEVYDEVVEVRFGKERIALRPHLIDFQIDVDQMVMEAGQFLHGTDFIDIALRYGLGFGQRRRSVPVRFTINQKKLRSWLEQVAAEHNSTPQPPHALTPADRWSEGAESAVEIPPGFVGAYTRDWTWVVGSSGYTLDLEASLPRVIDALTRPDHRQVDLVLDETKPPTPSMLDLSAVLSDTLSNFPGFATVYVRDLTTDEEANVDVDVAFSGMSTMKIGIATAIMRKLPHGIAADDETAQQVGQWLDYALGESNNFAANQLLTFLGDGDIGAGTRYFTQVMQELGYTSTYMQSGYDSNVQLPQISTPGNQQTVWDTNPDSNLQSTPREMGEILSAIYECTQGKGHLLEVFPNDITSDECWQILYYMTHDEFQELAWAGLPKFKQQWIVHKHGFAFETHSDVALVWGPTGPYVISIFLYRKNWMDWGTSNGTMQDLSRITWNFFAFESQLTGKNASAPPLLKPPPGYKAIKEYIPVVSRGEKIE
ncbi:MAG: serine hydrolase [Caldilineaceae bacterium]